MSSAALGRCTEKAVNHSLCVSLLAWGEITSTIFTVRINLRIAENLQEITFQVTDDMTSNFLMI